VIKLRKYQPHDGQKAFHDLMNYHRYMAMICGIRGGKSYSGAREALKQAWNAKGDGVFGIVAPTYQMLKRTTWALFKDAARFFIAPNGVNDSDFIITLRNGRKVHGHTAEHSDRIRNENFIGAWVDEARECKDFANLWNILLGRVLSTQGKIFITTSPNSYDAIHDIFIANRNKDTCVVKFATSKNSFVSPEAIAELEARYDEKFARQELYGEFVIFEGAVYYTFNRQHNSGDIAFKVAQYDAMKPIWLCADFNIDPMAWVIAQPGINTQTNLKEVYAVDEIFMKNCNTVDACQEFKTRYQNHQAGIVLYGDATGRARHTDSNITNWKIIETELARYGITNKVPTRNPAERDRVNAVNGMICNSKKQRRVYINPDKCKNLIRDLEQVSYKDGTTQIDKSKSLSLTHASDALGYCLDYEFSLDRNRIMGLKI
jgi:hypothetical protein